MWFALTIIGIWGLGTLGACITKDASIYSDLALITLFMGFGYLIYKSEK